MSNTEIIKVTQYIKYYIDNYSIIENERLNLFEELCFHIAYVLREWSGNTYVGIEKEKVKKNIFQNFFILLNDLINYLTKNKTSSLESEFLKYIKYNGKLYRYLGTGNPVDIKMSVKPIYNDIYVSWSKEERNAYIESKLYGKMTILYCDTLNKYFGIDLEGFQEFYNKIFKDNFYISRGNEREVVFPTIKETIYDIKYLQ